jgi:uncharacterized protein
MLLDLSRLRDGAEERVVRTWPAASFEATEDFAVAAPVSFDAVVRKDKQAYHLVGRAATELELNCSRCTEPFRAPVETAFDLRYLPHRDNVAPGAKGRADEHEIQEDDLSTAFYRDETIDLGELVREQFYLALPMKPLCTEACKGLCPQCGTNLNRATCDCRNEWVDPRFEKLKALKRDT